LPYREVDADIWREWFRSDDSPADVFSARHPDGPLQFAIAFKR
jgi:hypothetical protein